MEHLASHNCSLESSKPKECVMFSGKAGGGGCTLDPPVHFQTA